MKEFDFGIANTTTAEFNTNNAWGFGGGYGTEYTFTPELSAKIGIACYRHSRGSKYITVTHNSKRIFDKVYSGKNISEAKELIESILKTN